MNVKHRRSRFIRFSFEKKNVSNGTKQPERSRLFAQIRYRPLERDDTSQHVQRVQPLDRVVRGAALRDLP